MQKIKIAKYLTIFIVLAGLSTNLTSCLKETSKPPLYGYSTPSLVYFQDNGGADGSGTGYATSATTPFPLYAFGGLTMVNDTAGFNAIVIYGPNGPASQDISVNLVVDPTIVDSFNDVNGSSYVVPDASIYSFPSSVVIKKGQTQAYAHVTIKLSSSFDFNASYALPLKIASVSYGSVSSNFGSELNTFGARNQYDGTYSFKGYTLRAGDGTKTGNFTGQTMVLQTYSANSVIFGSLQVWADLTGVGIGYPILTVNSDNSVTVTSSGGAANTPGYNSHYNPSSKTFYVSFTWGAGPTSRLATDTISYTGPR